MFAKNVVWSIFYSRSLWRLSSSVSPVWLKYCCTVCQLSNIICDITTWRAIIPTNLFFQIWFKEASNGDFWQYFNPPNEIIKDVLIGAWRQLAGKIHRNTCVINTVYLVPTIYLLSVVPAIPPFLCLGPLQIIPMRAYRGAVYYANYPVFIALSAHFSF